MSLEKASFDKNPIERICNGEKTIAKLLKSLAVMASGISTIFIPENSFELFDRLNLLIQDKQAGKIFNIFIKEIVAIADKKLE